MDYTKTQTKIHKIILELFQKFHIQSFPLDCFQLIEDCGYRIITYQQMRRTNVQLYEYCQRLSDDAFHFKPKKLVAYNEDQSFYRIRFSLMHELGHIVLNHSGDHQKNEREANYFASHILAPRMAVYYAKPADSAELSHMFQISREAARIVLSDMQLWYQHTRYHMTQLDQQLYQHFYNENARGFVYHIAPCFYCLAPVYNHSFQSHSGAPLCLHCLHRQFRQTEEVLRKKERLDRSYRIIRQWEERESP